MKNLVKVLCVVVAISFALSSLAYAAEKESFLKKVWNRIIPKQEPASPSEKSVAEEKPSGTPILVEKEKVIVEGAGAAAPELPKEEMIRFIKESLDAYGDKILERLPAVVRKADKDGKNTYFLKLASGKEVNIDILDKEKLTNLYQEVATALGITNYMMVNEQLKSLKDLPKLPEVPAAVTNVPVPANIPKIPDIETAPNISVPKAVEEVKPITTAPQVPQAAPKVYTPPKITAPPPATPAER